MIFHINATMPDHKSGIEHAEIKRFNLFKHFNVAQRLVLREWDPNGHVNVNAAGISDDELINMFDYFQGTAHVEAQQLTAEMLDFGVSQVSFVNEDEQSRFLVMSAQGQLVARVNYDKLRHQQVRSVELFDGYNNLFRVDHYDSRGFRSLLQWYSPDNKIELESWVTQDGTPVLEAYYKHTMADQTGLTKTSWHLHQVDGQVYQFDTIEALTTHFFDLINRDFWSIDHPNIFILDRAHLGDEGLLRLKQPAYTVMHLHNSHAGDAQEPMHSILNNNYEYAMNALNQYDSVVSATPQQTRDVKARFVPTNALFTIPVGIVDDALLNAKRVPVKARTFGKVIAFARIAWEKHLDDLVRAVGIVKKEFPEVTLDLYGYADGTDNFKARRAVEAAIAEYHLEDAVSMKGYTTDIDAVENDAMMYGLTSRMEGFNLAIMEAISHGLISFTYDVNYGPNEIVQDDVNGRIVPYENYQAMADAMLQVLRDEQLAQRYSDGAYDSAQRYSEKNVMAAWQALIDDAAMVWPAKLAASPAIASQREGE
ncbi:glycosyltransferase [Weissella diestrammenae]|uniref:Glycosyltransferase n=1 Tax=Weissella diestrammenae TaxID=1162633 RepID=A0A7G9T3K2_9LACO|nr:glycosyltransferase [Weissella diestrammenae]MCM0582648.1 glycosyltransferase [Weissella diestrammenae]QNN74677.1 glycosyltransferase [Weissella diestrammenae]